MLRQIVQQYAFWIASYALQHLYTRVNRFAQEKRDKKIFPRLPVQVDGTLGHASLPDNIVDGGLFIAPALHQLGGCIQYAVRLLSPLLWLLLWPHSQRESVSSWDLFPSDHHTYLVAPQSFVSLLVGRYPHDARRCPSNVTPVPVSNYLVGSIVPFHQWPG